MVDTIKEFFEKLVKSRIFVLGAIFFVLFTILVIRIFNLQIVNKDYYLNNYIQKSQKPIYTSGTRGNIYDRNGQVLAGNELAYAVTIEDSLESTDDKSEKLNEIIYKTIEIIEKNGDSLINDFGIILNADGSFSYTDTSEKGTSKNRFLSDIYGIKVAQLSEKGTDKKTAEEAFEYLCGSKKYAVNKDYTDEEKLKIIMIRYNLSLNNYQKYITTTIASNVSENTVAAIYENSVELTGVSISEQSSRVYDQGLYFAHILGYTGQISEDQLTEYNTEAGDDEYIAGDIVGKSGIEKEMDSYLKGTRGEETVFVNSVGKVLETTDKTDPEAGNDVYLTIDKDLSIAAYKILEQKLAGILYGKIVNANVNVTENTTTIKIPVKDVYYQIINNNIVDLSKFSLDTASENERNIYNKFVAKQGSAIDMVAQNLTNANAGTLNSLTEENNAYLSYVYESLSSSDVGIINTSSIDTGDETYTKWTKGTISLREFLLYAISKNWIDTANIGTGEKYANSDEVYNALVNYIIEKLKTDTGFSKKIYYYLIYNDTISGNEVCLLLYNQHVLEDDETAIMQLSNGNSGTAFEFIREQIRLLKITPAQLALDPCSGSCVVTDTDTGDVLALVTYPSYDNNMLSGTVDATYWNKINNDLSLPLYNRATQTRTAPGSTFKMVTAITGLEEGEITPTQQIVDQGEFTKITPSPRCWIYSGSGSTHGAVNVTQALAVSCNYFFYQVGYNLSLDSSNRFDNNTGLDKLEKYAAMLGLTSLSGVQIEENAPRFSTTGSVVSAIGQGSHNFANIQLARYVNTVANRGYDYSLTLLDKVQNSDGTVVEEYEPNLVGIADVSDSTWNAVQSGMREVITTGTARSTFSGMTIDIAGKSGTAQENALRANHAVFVAYAPYSLTEKPEISVSVLLPNGDSSGYAGEIVRDVIEYYYNQISDEEVSGGTATVPTSEVTHE